MVTNGEHRLPTRDWVGSDNGMDGLEDVTNVLWCSTLLVIEFEAVLIGRLLEARLSVCSSQALEEFLIWGGNPIVYLITRGPECI